MWQLCEAGMKDSEHLSSTSGTDGLKLFLFGLEPPLKKNNDLRTDPTRLNQSAGLTSYKALIPPSSPDPDR